MSGAARVSGTLTLLGLLIAIPSAMVGGLWWRATAEERQRVALQRQLEEQRQTFEMEIGRLLGETRRAEFRVVGRREENGVVYNKILFVEFLHEDDKSSPSPLKKVIELPGSEFYIDAVLARFDDEAVRQGKARNFAVFRRAFTELVAPEEGVSLYDIPLREARTRALKNVEMSRPADADAFVERMIGYLANPALARKDGIRMIEGEAKYVVPKPGFFYEVIQKASGGLLIEEHVIPTVLADDKQD
jgi:hypothetical protein